MDFSHVLLLLTRGIYHNKYSIESDCIQQTKLLLSTNNMSSQFKTILVVGATGNLGSKVTEAFIAKKQFDVRILVRKTGDKAKDLELKGAKIIEADFSSLDSLTKVGITSRTNIKN